MLVQTLKMSMVSLLCTLTTLCFPESLSANIIANPYQVCELSTTMRESSGLVAYGRETFWTINDGGNGPRLHAADTSGSVFRTIQLLNGNNYDWEDMTIDDDGNIYIADIGDKNAVYSPSGAYDDLSIYKIPNPDYHCNTFVSAEIISFRFPASGEVDNAEGMFYHDGYLYLVTKNGASGNEWHAGQALLYRVPAQPSASQYIAQYVTSLDINPNGGSYYKVGGAALSPDGELLALIGESRMWVISDFTDGVFFDGNVSVINFGTTLQRESVAFVGNREIYITDEDESAADPTDGFLGYLDICPHLNLDNVCDQAFNVARSRTSIYYNTAQENSNGQVTNNSNTVSLGANQLSGFRFDYINIPQGAKITNAYIQFNSGTTQSINTNLTIYGEATADANVFVTSTQNIANRQRTQHSVGWQPASWVVNNAKQAQRSPDISSIIQEIISHNNWNNFNAMAFIVEGTGSRTVKTESNCNLSNPELIIDYYMPLELNVNVWLEGAYNTSTNSMSTAMNTAQNILPGQDTPKGQPYYGTPWNHNSTEGLYYHDGNYANNVVDWLLVSLRTGIQANTTVAKTAVLLKSNGTIEEVIPLPLSEYTTGSYYIVIEHRNHMGIMSSTPVNINNGLLYYSFKNTNSYKNSTSSGQKQLEPGIWGMFGGDANQAGDIGSYDINANDKIMYSGTTGSFYIYSNADFNLDGDVNGADKEIWQPNLGTSSIVPK